MGRDSNLSATTSVMIYKGFVYREVVIPRQISLHARLPPPLSPQVPLEASMVVAAIYLIKYFLKLTSIAINNNNNAYWFLDQAEVFLNHETYTFMH